MMKIVGDDDSASRSVGAIHESPEKIFVKIFSIILVGGTMELNINSPAYFKDHYGFDNAVYNFFQEAYLYFKDKEYSDTLHIIGITPIVAPNEMFNGEIWKESIRLIDNKSCAIISFRIDFDEYNNGDSEKRILLTKELILKAIRKIKSKVDFDYEAFERDLNILSF